MGVNGFVFSLDNNEGKVDLKGGVFPWDVLGVNGALGSRGCAAIFALKKAANPKIFSSYSLASMAVLFKLVGSIVTTSFQISY